MSSQQESQFQTILKDPIMKWIVRVIGMILLAFAMVVLVKAIAGRPVSVLGIQINMEPPDTVFLKEQVAEYPKPEILTQHPSDKRNKSQSTPKDKLAESKRAIQKNNNGDNNFVGGNNNGIIGGENNTQNNFGIIPRVLSDKDLSVIPYYFPDKETLFAFVCYNGADAEVVAVRDQIISFLQRNGYRNIEKEFRTRVGFEPPDRIRIDSIIGRKMVEISIPPNKL